MTHTSTVVLVHGAWHGAWCFAALQHALDDLGVPSYAIDLPGHGASLLPLADLHTDADHVAAVLDRIDGPVVLVGHSYGGAVVSRAAAGRSSVQHLVYLAAFALHADESVMSLLRALPPAQVGLAAAMRSHADNCTVLDPVLAAPALYGDCPAPAVKAALARLSPQPQATMVQPLEISALGTVPSTYVVCQRDDAVHPSHQSAMAERCTHSVAFNCDHSPFLSRTADTAALLHRLATS
jgi:pimeloyl-ACP methyl ester carboxylesterase